MPDALFLLGRAYLESSEYTLSINSFRDLYDKYKDHQLAPQALLYIGNVYYALNQSEIAERYYTKLINEYSKSNTSVDGYYRLSEILYERNEKSKAIELLRNSFSNFSEKSISDKLRNRMVEILIEENDLTGVEIILEDILRRRTDSIAAEAQFLKGKLNKKRNEYQTALDDFLKVRFVYSTYKELVLKASLEASDCFILLNKKDEAKKLLDNIIKEDEQGNYKEIARKKLEEIK